VKRSLSAILLPLLVSCSVACGGASAQVKAASATATQRGATYVALQAYGFVVDACELTLADPKLAAVSAQCDELLPVAHDLITETFLVVDAKNPLSLGVACDLAKATETLSTLAVMLPSLTAKQVNVLKDADELAHVIAPLCPAAVDAGKE
jgi:hypothetical protein